MRNRIGVVLAGWWLLGSVGVAQEADWPQWRGPRGDGVSRESGWTLRFDAEGPPKLWEAKVGRGFSSPVLRDGRLYLLSTEPGNLQEEAVTCLDAGTGEQLWQHRYEIQSVRRAGNPAGGTPALVNGRVFSYGAGMNLVCLDAKTGTPLWSNDLMKSLPGQPAPYGFQLSPTPFEKLIIVPALKQTQPHPNRDRLTEPKAGKYPETGGVLLAFDQATGEEVWRNTEGASAWSSPMLADIEGKKTLIHLTGRYLLGLDPANGLTRWKVDLRTVGIEAEDMAASPLVQGNIIVAPIHKAYGSVSQGTAGSAAFVVRQGKPTLLWKNTQWCHWFQPAAIWQGFVYAFDDRSTFWCLDLQTGKDLWKSKDLGPATGSGGAFLIADGKVLAIDSRQHLTIAVVSAKGPELLSRAGIFRPQTGFQCETAPVLLNGRLYCRNHTQLICFDLRPKK